MNRVGASAGRVFAWCLVAIPLLTAGRAVAHDSPGDMVHALTHRIETSGPSARLLAARAYEYQALGQWDAAVVDFRAALAQRPDYGLALTGLGQTYLRQGRFSDAVSVAHRGLATTGDGEHGGPYHALHAEAEMGAARWEAALAAWDAALGSHRPAVDWYLGQAHCLAQLGRYTERAQALANARTRNPSAVLYRTWVRALVDAGQFEAAAREVASHLDGARWQASWLLLRARIRHGQGDLAGQGADARQALAEIHQRWGGEGTVGDPFLLVHAAMAFALLGQGEEAHVHLDAARRRGVPERRLFEFERVIRALAHPAP